MTDIGTSRRCSAPVVGDQESCPAFGLAQGFATELLALIPAVMTGTIVALLGHAARLLIVIPQGRTGADGLLGIVLGTTVPYFDWVFAFVGGWCATVASGSSSWWLGAMAGSLVGLLYPASLFLAGRLGVPTPWLALEVAATASAVAGLFAAPLSDPLGRVTGVSRLQRVIPGGRYIATPINAAFLVALALCVYALVLIAIVVGLVALAIYLGCRLVFGGERPAPQLHIPNGGRIREDGRIVRGQIFEEETGQRIDADGRVVQVGLLQDQTTGLRIDDAGRVVVEGLLGDTFTGVRLEKTSSGGTSIVNEGPLWNDSTGLALDSSGRAVKTGLLWDDATGIAIDAQGAHQVHTDLARNGQAVSDGRGGVRFVERGWLGSVDTGVGIDAAGQGHRAGLLGSSPAELRIDESGLVKERR